MEAILNYEVSFDATCETDKECETPSGLFYVNKPVCWTPLQCIDVLRTKTWYMNNCKVVGTMKLGYSGRLDPLARGLMVILVGSANLNRTYFDKLDKAYRFTVLFGYATDTQDLLGLVTGKKSP